MADYRAQQADADSRQGWPSPQSAQNWQAESSVESSQDTAEGSRRDSEGLEGHIASTDLLNPSDALHLLAQVADLDPGGRRSSSARDAAKSRNAARSGDAAATACFPPVANRMLTWPEASYLVRRCASRPCLGAASQVLTVPRQLPRQIPPFLPRRLQQHIRRQARVGMGGKGAALVDGHTDGRLQG